MESFVSKLTILKYFSPQGSRVDQFSIVCNSNHTKTCMNNEGLSKGYIVTSTRCGVPSVTNTKVTLESCHDWFIETLTN